MHRNSYTLHVIFCVRPVHCSSFFLSNDTVGATNNILNLVTFHPFPPGGFLRTPWRDLSAAYQNVTHLIPARMFPLVRMDVAVMMACSLCTHKKCLLSPIGAFSQTLVAGRRRRRMLSLSNLHRRIGKFSRDNACRRWSTAVNAPCVSLRPVSLFRFCFFVVGCFIVCFPLSSVSHPCLLCSSTRFRHVITSCSCLHYSYLVYVRHLAATGTLGLSNVPICVIDVDHFYSGFKMQLQRAHSDGLLYLEPDRLVHFESSPEAVSCRDEKSQVMKTKARE